MESIISSNSKMMNTQCKSRNHKIETFPFINDRLWENPPITGALSPVIRRLDVSFDISLNRLLYKHSVYRSSTVDLKGRSNYMG